MNTRVWLAVVVSLTFVAAGCAGPRPPWANTDSDSGVADACVPTATLPAATCADDVLPASQVPTGLTAGSATVLRLDLETDGRASLALEVGTVVTTLSLPAAPIVTVGDTVTVEISAVGTFIRSAGDDLLVYIGGAVELVSGDAPVDRGALIAANRDGAPLSIDVAGVPLTLEAACGRWIPHHTGSTYGCRNVPMAAFSVRHADTTVAPGDHAVAPLEDGLALVIENRGVVLIEEGSCEGFCGDLWSPGLGLTLVITAAE